jgi:hypothetical protein
VYPKHYVQNCFENLRNWRRHIKRAKLEMLSVHAVPANVSFFELAREGVLQTICSTILDFANLAMTDKRGQTESFEFPCQPLPV